MPCQAMSMVVVHVASSARNILVFLGRMAEATGHALHFFVLSDRPCLKSGTRDCTMPDGDHSMNLSPPFTPFFALHGRQIDNLLVLLSGPLSTEHPPFGFPKPIRITQMMAKGIYVSELDTA
jgi:hypothetical protein